MHDAQDPTSNPNPASPEMGAPVTPEQPADEKKRYGPLIGIIIIVGLIALGGLYFWGMQLSQEDEQDAGLEQADPVLEELQTQSSSDELSAIEADLQATSFEDLDAGASEAQAELEAQ